jgi:hypothetical protein
MGNPHPAPSQGWSTRSYDGANRLSSYEPILLIGVGLEFVLSFDERGIS